MAEICRVENWNKRLGPSSVLTVFEVAVHQGETRRFVACRLQ